MARKIQQIVVTDTTPDPNEMGVVVRPIGGSSGGGDVTIIAPLGQQTMAASIPVVIASNQSPVPISGTVSVTEPVLVRQGTSDLVNPWAVLQFGRKQNGQHFAGLGPTAVFDIKQGAGIFAFLVQNSGSFLGTIRVVGVVSGTLNILDQIYDVTANVVEQTVSQFDHVYMVPCAGLESVFLYVTAYTSGSFTFEFGAGPGAIYMPKGIQVVSGTVGVTGPVTVNAVNLDIRDLLFATDKVDVTGSVVDIVDDPTRDLGKVDVASLDQYTPIAGRLPVDGSGVIQPVSALDLDIRNLVFATDKVDISGSTGVGVTGPLTDAQLRATPVPVSISGPVTLAPAAPTFASVGTASAQVVAANVNRKGLILINTSNKIISLGFGAAAVLNSGVTLFPQGAYNMGEFDFYTGAVNAIASGSTSNLAIQEYS